MSDQADPSDDWPVSDINASLFPASNDWYGKLYTYLHGLLFKFVTRIGTASFHVELYNVDANLLPQYIELGKYSRIEVSCLTRVPCKAADHNRYPIYVMQAILA